MQFQQTLPVGCPPDTASHPQGKIVYRGVKSSSISHKDFLPNNSPKHKTRRRTLHRECQSLGISINETREGCKKFIDTMKAQNPYYWGDAHIAQGTLESDHGMIAPTGHPSNPCHATRRIAQGINASHIFTIII